jgi:Fe-S-cluster containining protein
VVQVITKVADILTRYRELCAYCEALTRRVEERFGQDWQCRAGCGGCCRLETVCGLEALVLLGSATNFLQLPGGGENGECFLLRDDRCLAYERRPLICRTHGLPLVSRELTGGEVDCCPLNLPALAGLGEIEADLVLDLDLVTENLLRLNLALFILLGRPELAETRYPLRTLVGGGKGLPPELLAAGRQLNTESKR